MPIYEYKCRHCQARFELKRSFSDDGAAAICPKCQGEAHRLFTPVPIIFKGSGFYVTDNRAPMQDSSDSPKESKAPKETKESQDSSKDSSKESPKETCKASKDGD